MKVQKYEIARAIDKLKSIVQKNDQFPALRGVLVKGGYLITSNSEITMKVKLEASEGNHFIIPMKAFDLIKNLPDGEVEICTEGQNMILIRTGTIRNKCQSFPPEQFSFDTIEDPGTETVHLDGRKLIEAIGHVIYAAADYGTSVQMKGIYLDGQQNTIRLVALDGHVVAVDSIPAAGADSMKLIIPKTAAKKLLSLGAAGDVELAFTKSNAIFRTKEYTVCVRLIQGEYFKYERMFQDCDVRTCISRPELAGAMARATMCMEERQPVVFKLEADMLSIRSADKQADYQEDIKLQEAVQKPMRLGFDSKLVLETLKAFSCDNVALGFIGPRAPMVVEAEDSDMKAMVLPVAIREE